MSRSTYYTICPSCGARLDPGERCDCAKGEKKAQEEKKLEEKSA